MAGMLPGVECARRRRVHQSGESPTLTNTDGCSRRPSFCLYASNHETHQTSTFSLQRSMLNQTAYMDEKLGVEARVAKGRLDEKLRTHERKSQPKRILSKEGSMRSNVDDGRSIMIDIRELQREVYGSKKKNSINPRTAGSRKFSWSKLSWKSSDQDECAVCLDKFRTGKTLVHLPCAHRFHSCCMVPWLQNNVHCPCCKMGIVSTELFLRR